MYGGQGEVYTGFWWGNLWERDHMKDPGIDWTYLAQDRDRWWAPVNVKMYLWVS